MQRSVPVTLEGLAIRLRGKMVVLGFALSWGRCGKLTTCFMVRAWGAAYWMQYRCFSPRINTLPRSGTGDPITGSFNSFSDNNLN